MRMSAVGAGFRLKRQRLFFDGQTQLTQPVGEHGLGHVVEGGHEVHLRGAGVGEAHLHIGGDEAADQGVGAGVYRLT